MSQQNESIRFIIPNQEDITQWWQWVSRLPEERHPFLPGGQINLRVQPANLICLACLGRRGGNETRKLDVCAGKDILVPVFVASYSEVELEGTIQSRLDRCIQETRKDKDGRNIEFSVDNIYVDPYFLVTETSFPVHHPNMCTKLPKDKPEGDYQTVSAGYWCKLSLPERQDPYIIKFGGDTDIEVGEFAGEFKTHVTYEITVKKC